MIILSLPNWGRFSFVYLRPHLFFQEYNEPMREILLMVHPTTGALAIFCAIWFMVEVFNASEQNRGRTRLAALSSMLLMVATYITGGYWYVVHYAADKAIILGGAWPFAHTFFMEAKEHAFFITLILSLFLVIVARREDFVRNRSARTLALCVALLVVASAFAIEGAGSLVAMGVRIGLMQPGI